MDPIGSYYSLTFSKDQTKMIQLATYFAGLKKTSISVIPPAALPGETTARARPRDAIMFTCSLQHLNWVFDQLLMALGPCWEIVLNNSSISVKYDPDNSSSRR
jgi:hypothetical protein